MQKVGGIILEKLLNTDEGISSEKRKDCLHGHRAKYMGVREKEVITVVGKIRLRRNYYYDVECGKGWCPKDLELGIENSSFSPGVRRMMGRVGSNRPFALSEEDLLELAGLNVNAKAIERTCHELGKEAEAYVSQLPVDVENTPNEIMYISMDGTGVPVLKSESEGRKGKVEGKPAKTREVKLGCVFTQTEVDEENFPIRQEQSTTYVGAIENSGEFGKRINAEVERRGVEKAKKLCIIGDGALWIWNIAKEYFWNAIEIIDLYHAREHYWDTARLVFPAKSKQIFKWTKRRKEELDSGNVEAVIKALRRLRPKTEEAQQSCQSSIGYFEQNKKRMRYDKFRAQGLFVGSGVIEAGCRSVIGQRLKQSGMHWSVRGANSIIALRCLIRSNGWEDFWEFKSVA